MRARIPIAYDSLRPKRSDLLEQGFSGGRLTLGDGNYQRRRNEMGGEVVPGWEGGNDRGGRVYGVGVVLVEVAYRLL